MRDAVLDELVTVVGEVAFAVPAGEAGRGIEHPGSIAGVEDMVEQRPGEASRPGVVAGGDAADPGLIIVVEDPEVGDNAEVVGHPDVAGAILEVSTVEFGVDARLFDDEHVDSQSHDVVELSGGELGEAPVLDLHGVERSGADLG